MGKSNEITDKVKSECKKKVDTTMIGALCAIEEVFGDLWNHKSLKRTKEQSEWYNKYEELRSRILDNGNNQKRKLETELDNYEIQYKTYHYDFVIKSRKINEKIDSE